MCICTEKHVFVSDMSMVVCVEEHVSAGDMGHLPASLHPLPDCCHCNDDQGFGCSGCWCYCCNFTSKWVLRRVESLVSKLLSLKYQVVWSRSYVVSLKYGIVMLNVGLYILDYWLEQHLILYVIIYLQVYYRAYYVFIPIIIFWGIQILINVSFSASFMLFVVYHVAVHCLLRICTNFKSGLSNFRHY